MAHSGTELLFQVVPPSKSLQWGSYPQIPRIQWPIAKVAFIELGVYAACIMSKR